MLRTPQRARSANQVIGDILFVAKFISHNPNEYKKIYANAHISVGEAALSTGIAEKAIVSAMTNLKDYKCDNTNDFPLRYVIDLIWKESFFGYGRSYKYEIKNIIDNIQNHELRLGLSEIFSSYTSYDDNHSRAFEDSIHVMAEYLRMHQIDGVRFAPVNIKNVNSLSNEINIDLSGLNALKPAIEALTEAMRHRATSSTTAAGATITVDAEANEAKPTHQPPYTGQRSPAAGEAQAEVSPQLSTANGVQAEDTTPPKPQAAPDGAAKWRAYYMGLSTHNRKLKIRHSDARIAELLFSDKTNADIADMVYNDAKTIKRGTKKKRITDAKKRILRFAPNEGLPIPPSCEDVTQT